MLLIDRKKNHTGVFKRIHICRGMAIILSAILFCGILAGCEKDTEIVLTTGFKENEVFRIEGHSCYTPELMIYLINIRNQYEDVFGEEIWDQQIDGIPIEDSIKQTVLARIAKIKMMNLLADNYGVVLDNRELALAESAASEYYHSLSDIAISAMGGIEEDTIRQLYEEYALANKVYQYLVADVNPEISDDEARTVTVHQIFLATSYDDENGGYVSYTETEKQDVYRQAENILLKITAGEDFDVLASTYSNAEELTAYYRKGEQEKELEDVVFNLGEDEISDIIEGARGYYIFRCISTYDMEQTEAAKQEILRERQQQVFNSIYELFIVDKHCYLNEELWDTVSFTEGAAAGTSDFFDIYEKYFITD